MYIPEYRIEPPGLSAEEELANQLIGELTDLEERMWEIKNELRGMGYAV